MIPVKRLTSAVVTDLVRRQPLTSAKVDFAWQMAAGPALARVTDATLCDDGTVLVTTASAAWSREVTRSRDMLLGRLRGMLGSDVAVRLAVRPSSQAP
jgi:predicted nucleic acid-binding Zn ribbon protein